VKTKRPPSGGKGGRKQPALRGHAGSKISQALVGQRPEYEAGRGGDEQDVATVVVPVIVFAVTRGRQAIAVVIVHNDIAVVTAMFEAVATTPVVVVATAVVPAAALWRSPRRSSRRLSSRYFHAIVAVVPVAITTAITVMATIMAAATLVGEGGRNSAERNEASHQGGSNETHEALLSIS
jgi:hypothetical protein